MWKREKMFSSRLFGPLCMNTVPKLSPLCHLLVLKYFSFHLSCWIGTEVCWDMTMGQCIDQVEPAGFEGLLQ